MKRWHERRLHHQLFAWLALTIFATAVVSGLVFALLEPAAPPYGAAIGQVGEFAARQFAERWQDESARAALARDVAQTFGVQIRLTGKEGELLFSSAPGRCHGPNRAVEVSEAGRTVGHIEACLSGYRHFRPLIALSVLASACLVLWTAAALLARRITRPLSLLIATTREIGSGNLGARVRLRRHHGGELRLLAESVNEMAGRIERQIKDQRELLAAVSHEVRSPLARLRLGAEILRTDPGNVQALEGIELEVVELDNLVGQLLASSRLDFETLNARDVTLGDLFRQVLSRHQLTAATLDDRSEGAAARVDPTLIARALDNLLENAVRHGGGVAGAAAYRSTDSAQRIVFEVRDRGAGFAADVLPHVFEPFYRGSGAARGAGGSLGLGLSLVRRIARAHGGDAWAQNAPDGGAIVAFSVNAATRPVSASHRAPREDTKAAR